MENRKKAEDRRRELISLVDEYRKRSSVELISPEQFLADYPQIDREEFLRELEWDQKFDWGQGLDDGISGDHESLSAFLASEGDSTTPGYEGVLDQRFEEKERLGSGGFGLVLRCFDREMQRDVAIKIPRGISDDDRRLFIHEARAAARIKHPNVATIFDVIRIGDSAMIISEFIEGRTLRDILDSRQGIKTKEAVRLMMTVASGVHAAHEMKLIHGDLKPSNIIVDDHGQPQIIDFGLAKYTAERHGAILPDQLLGGTSGYMSPEHKRGKHKEIKPPSDIYAIGLILRELLGESEATESETTSRSEHTPSPGATSSVHANQRCPAGIDAICKRCLQTDPIDRYPTAEEVVSDLQRFLDHFPVSARSYSTSQRCWMWCRRNRTATIAIASMVVVAATVIFALAWNNVQSRIAAKTQNRLTELAEAEKNNAVDASKEAEDILNFVNNEIFHAASPEAFGGYGSDITLLEAVEAAEPAIESYFPDRRLVQASIRQTLGKVFRELSEPQKAYEQLKKSYESYLAQEGPESLNTLIAKREMVAATLDSPDMPNPRYALIEEVHATMTRLFGSDHPETLKTRYALGLAAFPDDREMLKHLQIAYDGLVKINGPTDRDTLNVAHDLALRMYIVGQLQESKELFEATLKRTRRAFGDNHVTMAATLNLARIYDDMGERTKSQAMLEQLVEQSIETFGPNHIKTAFPIINLATSYAKQGMNDELQKLIPQLQTAYEVLKLKRGLDHHNAVMAGQNLAAALISTGRKDEGIRLWETIVDHTASQFGENNDVTWERKETLAIFYRHSNRLEDAANLCESIYDHYVQRFGKDDKRTRGVLVTLRAIKVKIPAMAFLNLTRGKLPGSKTRTKTTTIELPQELVKRVDAAAKKSNLSREEWLRQKVSDP